MKAIPSEIEEKCWRALLLSFSYAKLVKAYDSLLTLLTQRLPNADGDVARDCLLSRMRRFTDAETRWRIEGPLVDRLRRWRLFTFISPQSLLALLMGIWFQAARTAGYEPRVDMHWLIFHVENPNIAVCK